MMVKLRGVGFLEFVMVLVIVVPLVMLGVAFILLLSRLKDFEIFDEDLRRLVRTLESEVSVDFDQVSLRPRNPRVFNQRILAEIRRQLQAQGYLEGANCFLSAVLFQVVINQNTGIYLNHTIVSRENFTQGQVAKYETRFEETILPQLDQGVTSLANSWAKRFPLGSILVVHPLGSTWLGVERFNFLPQSFALGYYVAIDYPNNRMEAFALPIIRAFYPEFDVGFQKTGLIPVLF